MAQQPYVKKIGMMGGCAFLSERHNRRQPHSSTGRGAMARDDIMKGRYAQTLWDMTARRRWKPSPPAKSSIAQAQHDRRSTTTFPVSRPWLATCSSSGSLPPPKTALSARRGLKASSLSRLAPPKGPCFSRDSRGLAAGPSSSQVHCKSLLHLHPSFIGKKRMHPKCYHSVSCRLLRLRHRWRVFHLDNGERTERSLCGKPHHVRGDAFGTETIPRRSCAHSTLQRKRDGYRPGEPLLPLPDVSCHPWIRTNRRADRASSRRTNAKRFAPVQHRRKRRRGEIRSHTCLPTARSRAQFLP